MFSTTRARKGISHAFDAKEGAFNAKRTIFAPLARLLILAALTCAVHAQQKIDPGRGVNWPAGCTAGQAYSPVGNTCVNPGATVNPIGAVYQTNYFTGSTIDARIQNCLDGLSATFGGTCDARQEPSATLSSTITVSTPNSVLILPCATLTTAYQYIVTPGTRNHVIEGCSYQGGSTASGVQGGSVWIYTGSSNAFQIGDLTYAVNTPGFWMKNVNINTASAGANAQGIYIARSQEVRLDSIYLNGNGGSGQTAITLDGTGNYAGGTFIDVYANNFNTGWLLTGHLSGSVVGDFSNASIFVKTHIVCPTSGGSPVTGTFGINVVAGDGNTWSGGDVEGCDTMFHMGANAVNNTVDGLRNEQSNTQYLADRGSSFNAVFTGGTFFTGKLVDNGSRNSFWDAFHRTANGVKGDWYASQIDSTITNHYRLGIGTGNIRGLQWESSIDSGTSGNINNWIWGMGDGAGNGTSWFFEDLINNVTRLVLTQGNVNNQSALNSTGTAFVCINCSANSGTGGLNVSNGGSSPTAVATINGIGNTWLAGTLTTVGSATFEGSVKVFNSTDAEIDYILQAGLTTSQKESLIYKDYNGNSQWYILKDASNNYMIQSATGGLDALKAYQSTNSGDLYLDTSNTSGAIRLNYEAGSGSSTVIYAGGTNQIAAFTGTTAIRFPGLASSTQSSIPRLDASGYLTNSNVGITSGSGGPGGGCTAPAIYFNTGGTSGGNNNIYVCSAGSWLAVK